MAVTSSPRTSSIFKSSSVIVSRFVICLRELRLSMTSSFSFAYYYYFSAMIFSHYILTGWLNFTDIYVKKLKMTKSTTSLRLIQSIDVSIDLHFILSYPSWSLSAKLRSMIALTGMISTDITPMTIESMNTMVCSLTRKSFSLTIFSVVYDSLIYQRSYLTE